MRLPKIETVYGVDFSGAAQAGRTTWIARLEVPADGAGRMVVADLRPLGRLCGSWERAEALEWLVGHIAGSKRAL